MASPQIENGYIRIANEIWDEVIRRDFSKRQKDIIFLIWRLSYGCQKRTAYIPKMVYFELAGVRRNHIKDELIDLENWGVIKWDRGAKTFEFNKNYDQWKVPPVSAWDDLRMRELIAVNLVESSQNGNKEFLNQEQNIPETGINSSQKGNEMFLKRELASTPDTEKFPKQEYESSQNGNKNVPETGISTGFNPLMGAGSEASKDNKDIIKDSSSSNKVIPIFKEQPTGSHNGSADFSFSRIYQTFESNFTRDRKIAPLDVEELNILFDDYGGEWLYEAMRETKRQSQDKHHLAYIHSVLKGFKRRGGPGSGKSPADEQRIENLDEDEQEILRRLRLAEAKNLAQHGAT